MADAAEPDKRDKATSRSATTALVAALGGLGLLWLMRPDTPAKADTAKERAETLQLLETHLGVPGAASLHDYLVKDGFLDFTWRPAGAPTGNNSQLILGAGTGKHVWPHALDALQSFNRPGGGTKLHAAVTKAINGSPLDDDPASRALIMKWLDTFVKAGDPGFKQLFDDLQAGRWTSGKYEPPTPPAPQPKLWLNLSIGNRTAPVIIDYPRWLERVTTSKILETVDPIAYPTDPSRSGRDLIWLQVQLAASQKTPIPGFASLSSILEGVGWTVSPYDKKVPKPGTFIEPLGGIAKVDMSSIDYTVAGVGALVEDAISTYDITAVPRNIALAALKNVANHKWSKYFTNFDVLAEALDTAGFAESPRGTRPVPGGGVKDFWVTGVVEERPVWSDRPTNYNTLQDFCSSATAAEVQRIAQAADTYTLAQFQRWVILQTFLSDVWTPSTAGIKSVGFNAAELITRGILLSPPQINPGYGDTDLSVVFTNSKSPSPEYPGFAPTAFLGPPGVGTGATELQRFAWQAYWVACSPKDFDSGGHKGRGSAPAICQLTLAKLKNGDPVIGVPRCTYDDLAAIIPQPLLD